MRKKTTDSKERILPKRREIGRNIVYPNPLEAFWNGIVLVDYDLWSTRKDPTFQMFPG